MNKEVSVKIGYRLVFIKYFIIKNIIKFLLLFLLLVIYHFAGSFDDEKFNSQLVEEVYYKVGDETKWFYIIKNERGQYYELLENDERLVIKNSYVENYKYSEVNVLLWGLFSIISVIFLGYIISVGEDIFRLKEVRSSTLLSLISCEYEDGWYYYLIFGRLINKSEKQLNSYDIFNTYNTYINPYSYRVGDILRCPKFKTKTTDRSSKLESLGI